MAEYLIPIRCTYQGFVSVEAESPEAALDAANKGDWQAEDMRELVDWETTGRAKENS